MDDYGLPLATYRLQFNRGFRFRDAAELAGYFRSLGITDIYASPILTSRKGSTHGYDATDPTQIDPDIGSDQDFQHFQAELRNNGLRLVLDIVPNHMAASNENRWWMDVLENGRQSGFASFFDIDWSPPSRHLEGKVLLPVLGRPFGEALDRGELQLVMQDGRFFVRYLDFTFPIMVWSYRRLLKHRVDELKNLLTEESPAYQEYVGIVAALYSLSETARSEAEKRVQSDSIRERLQHMVATRPEIAKFLSNNVAEFNGKPGDPSSFCALESLLAEQKFLLAYWLDPNEAINYRRFFAITDLVGIRAEDPMVFDATHDEILHLVAREAVRGVRVDHVDGLRDPVGYLQRLRDRLAGAKGADAAPPYILVEKILSRGEALPEDWPVSGTTGYEYLNIANGLFTDPVGARALKRGYFEFIGRKMNFADVVYEKKKLIMSTLLRVEMRSLGRQIGYLAARDRYARNLLRAELMDALIETTACLPVYRTYIRNLEVPPAAKQVIESAISEARRRRPRLSAECFDFVRDVLGLANPPHVDANQREERLAFVMRWQQFTGPIMAKGVEDTALYSFQPLLSLNEVGGDPDPSRIASREKFFEFIRRRQERWPDTLNATSTHDTKRSEGVRARLNVLSEIPHLYSTEIREWAALNAPHKDTVDGRKVPDAHEEYLIYQTIVGMWPMRESEWPAISKRLQTYVIKALREAMVNTRWMEPNVAYEKATTEFLRRILSPQENRAFLDRVTRLMGKIGYAAMVNDLGATLMKIACPGVPDFYQGTEVWEFHVVDPDNRSPVDYHTRTQALTEMTAAAEYGMAELAQRVVANWQDGCVKLFLIWRALGCRRENPELFRSGEFIPLEVVGERERHVISFLRRIGRQQALVVIPRCLVDFANTSDRCAAAFWKETSMKLPQDSPPSWRSAFTSQEVQSQPADHHCTLAVVDALRCFPVALFIGEV